MTSLYDPLRIGEIDLATRIVMAPLTRSRASAGQVPNELMATYYTQRADPATGAALIVTEATQIGPMAQGYLDTPGIHTQLGHVQDALRIGEHTEAKRPDRQPGGQVPQHRAQPQLLEQRHRHHGRTQQDHHIEQITCTAFDRHGVPLEKWKRH